MSNPELIRDKTLMRSWSRSHRSNGETLALIPTMGFLHEGHLSLIRTAQTLADLTVVSIYINPAQFAPSEDLSTYPSDLSADLQKLASIGVNAVFCPAELYHSGDCCLENGESEHETWIRVERLEKGLCGRSRPVFFRGVVTVVAKLFNLVEPDVAVFGKKDYQQWRVICRMVRDLDFAIEVIGLDIVREADGLAMSSRNVHLSPAEREKALSISRSLLKAKLAAEKGQKNCQELKDLVEQKISEAGGKIDYVEENCMLPADIYWRLQPTEITVQNFGGLTARINLQRLKPATPTLLKVRRQSPTAGPPVTVSGGLTAGNIRRTYRR